MSAKIFYITHAKGGVGATLFSTNLANTLAKIMPNKKILFLDANQLSDVATFFGIKNQKTILNLDMFLKENNHEKNIANIFDKVTYQINKLNVLLSPTEYYSPKKLNILYQKVITEAVKSYDYIIIDAEKNNGKLLRLIKPFLQNILVVTNIDNSAVLKTNAYLKNIQTKTDKEQIKIICNQADKFSLKELTGIFPKTIIGSLPTEINATWDNILLGVPITENKRLAYSKEVGRIIKRLLAM